MRWSRTTRGNAAHEFRHVWPLAVAKVVQQILARRPRRHGIDDGVPEPLQREHKRAHKLERDADLVLVDDRVHAVGAGRDPGDEDGREEEDGALGVRPRRIIQFMVATAVRVWHAGDARRRLRPRREAADRLGDRLGEAAVLAALDRQAHVDGLRRCDRLRSDVDGVGTRGLVAQWPRLRADGGVPTERSGGGSVRGVDGLAGDGDLGGAHRVVRVAVDGKGVGVGRLEVAQLLSLLVDCAPGADVDEECDDNDDPEGAG